VSPPKTETVREPAALPSIAPETKKTVSVPGKAGNKPPVPGFAMIIEPVTFIVLLAPPEPDKLPTNAIRNS
jgi:hypothetical protein